MSWLSLAGRRFAALAITSAALCCAARPAPALDFFPSVGGGGAPWFGWNDIPAHQNEIGKKYHVWYTCGGSSTFSIQFNAWVTQEDHNAGGYRWKLVGMGNQTLIDATIDCGTLRPVNTHIWGRAEFTLKCDPNYRPCYVCGVSLDNIQIWDGATKLCYIRNPPASYGCATGEGDIQLALQDVPAGLFGYDEPGSNHMFVGCWWPGSNDPPPPPQGVCSYDGPSHGMPGASVSTALVCDQPVFTDSTLLSIGLDSTIFVHDVTVVSPTRIEFTVDTEPGTAPGAKQVHFYNTYGGVGAPAFELDPMNWANLTLANLGLTVTNIGSVGFFDPGHLFGLGCEYPYGYGNHVNVGSFWLGRSGESPMNRDYSLDPSPEWAPGVSPGDALAFVSHGPPQETALGAFTNVLGSPSNTVRVEQFARADLNADWVYLRYRIYNLLGSPQSGVYAGLFSDFDVRPDPLTNVGATDNARRLAWVGNGTDTYLGVMGIQAGPPVALANATLIDNQAYVVPSGYIPDSDRWSFLSQSDPGHHLTASPIPANYGSLVSVGPLTLPVGGYSEVTFAVVGGSSLANLLTHADQAQTAYTADVPRPTPTAVLENDLVVRPNPFSLHTEVSFSLSAPGPVDLAVFDASGRRIRSLVRSMTMNSGPHQLRWDARDDSGRSVANGIYFVRLTLVTGTRLIRATFVH